MERVAEVQKLRKLTLNKREVIMYRDKTNDTDVTGDVDKLATLTVVLLNEHKSPKLDLGNKPGI